MALKCAAAMFGKITSRGATRTLLYISMAMAIAWMLFLGRGRLRIVPAEEGVAAEGIELIDFQGGRIDLEEFRGSVVLINVWASWCGPCISELPGLAEVHVRYADRGLVVLGVNIDEKPPAEILRIAEELEIPYPVVLPGGPFRGPFLTDGTIPHTWLLDREGRIRASHTGYASASSLDKACAALLEES